MRDPSCIANAMHCTRTRPLPRDAIQVYLPKEELALLRQAAARSGRSVAELVRDAIRKVVSYL
jgi:Ribbon-helix-helix protein, copG family